MRIVLIIVIIFFQFLSTEGDAATGKGQKSNFARGRKYFNEYRFSKAIKYYRKAIRENQADAELYADLAEAYYETSYSSEAILYNKKALSVDPNCLKAYYNLVKIYSKLRYDNIADIYYERAMSVQADNVEDYYYVGKLLNEFDLSPNDALPFFLKTVELDPGFVKGYYELGRVYRELGEDEKARENFTKAAKIDKYFSKAYQAIGELDHGTQIAVRYYTKAVDAKPFDVEAHLLLSETYDILNDYENAKNHCYEVIRRNPRYPEAYYKLAELYDKNGEHALFQMNMKKALKLYQDRGDQEVAALTAERLDADQKSLKKGAEKEKEDQ